MDGGIFFDFLEKEIDSEVLCCFKVRIIAAGVF